MIKTSALEKERASISNQSGTKRNAYISAAEVQDTGFYKSKKANFDIHLDNIVDRPNNEFEMEAIDEMAESIRERGQLSPIIVKDLKNGKFEIVAGHRRTAGMRRLYQEAKERYEQTGEESYREKMDLYSYIKANILTSEEEEFEYWIYLESNYEHRQNSFVTAIKHMEALIHKLKSQDDQTLLNWVFKGEEIPKNINLKESLFLILNEKLRIKDCSETTIARFLAVRSSKNIKLKEAMYSGVIPPTVAWKIHNYFTPSQQDALVDAFGTEKYESLRTAFEIENSTSKKKAKPKTFSKSSITSFRKKFVREVKPEAVDKANQLFDELEALLNG